MKAFMKKFLNGIRNIVKSFFYRGNDFQPVYFWVTVLMGLIVFMVWQRAYWEVVSISDTLLISCIGAVVTLLGIYNWNSVKNTRKTMESAVDTLKTLKDRLP